jgi:hypothetical protein
MTTRTTGTHLFNSATVARAIGAALVVMLFITLVLFVWLAPIRYAHGWMDVFAEGASAAPLAADGIVAIVSATLTAAAVVWLYLRQLAH